MKKLFLSIIILLSINGQSAELDGVSSISDGISSFFKPLQKGPKYIDESMKQVSNLSNEESEGSTAFKSELKKLMIQDFQGKVTSYSEIESRDSFNGNYVTKVYKMNFFGGKSKNVKFKFIKPTLNGNYQFVSAEFVD